jgi:L-rhamnonate dehydratase
MKITSIESNVYRVPVIVPLRKEPKHINIVLVEVATDEGISGYGITETLLEESVKDFLNHGLASAVIGRNPVHTERIWNDLFLQFNVRALSGVWSSAVSALDIALWDIKGKYYGEPVATLLGGFTDTVPAYITFGLREYDKAELAEVAQMLVGQGQTSLKMVVTHVEDVRLDAERVRAVRDAVGPDVRIMIDANYAFGLLQAKKLCSLIEDLDIAWFEEPVIRNDFKLLKELKKGTRIPISAGQNLGHVWHHRELIVNHAIDICQPNVVHVGGYTEGATVAKLAWAFNLPIANGGGWPHHNMHLQAAMPNGSFVEFHYLMWKAAEALFSNHALPCKGFVEIGNRPGVGLEPRADALKDFRI